MNGLQKVQAVFSLLGDESQLVLSKLSPKATKILTESMESAITLEGSDLYEFLLETLQKIEKSRNEHLFQSQQMSLEKDIEEIEEKSPHSTDESDSGMRSAQEIADLLKLESPQIRAFFLSKIDTELLNELLLYLPENQVHDFYNSNVEPIPLSDRVFQTIYDQLCQKPNVSTDGSDDIQLSE